MIIRIISSVVLIPPTLAAIWYGSPYFEALIVLGGIICVLEWGRLTNGGSVGTLGYTSLFLFLVTMGLFSAQYYPYAGGLLAAGTAGLLILGALSKPRGNFWTGAGFAYIGLACLALIAIRQVPGSGRDVIIWLFLVVWATDIGAYVFGRSIGGFKLAPSISPNKTWAGLIGGIASAIAVASIISATGNAKTGILTLIILSAAAALISQCGDLLESWIKRRFNAKDSGNLIPGHGGLLDRVDGLFLAAPAALLLIVVYQGGDMPWK